MMLCCINSVFIAALVPTDIFKTNNASSLAVKLLKLLKITAFLEGTSKASAD